MHFKMIIISKNERCCLNLLEQYREDKEVSYDVENDYWYNPDGRFDWMEIGGRFCALIKVASDCEEFSVGDRYILEEEDPYESEDPSIRFVDGAYARDILNIESIGGYGYVDSTGWYDRWDIPYIHEENLTAEEREQKAQALFDEGIRQKILEDKDQYVLVVDIHD